MFSNKHNFNNPIRKLNWDITHYQTTLFDPKDVPVKLLQQPFEFSLLLEEYFQLKPRNIIEIGTYCGGTLWYWLKHITAPGIVIAIDKFDQFMFDFDKNINNINMWESWIPNKINFHFINGDSNESEILNSTKNIIKLYSPNNERNIDFLFIDGDHRYEWVKKDFNTYGKLVRPGGIIAIHDIHFLETGVLRLWEEITLAGYKTKVLSDFKHCYGIGSLY